MHSSKQLITRKKGPVLLPCGRAGCQEIRSYKLYSFDSSHAFISVPKYTSPAQTLNINDQ